MSVSLTQLLHTHLLRFLFALFWKEGVLRTLKYVENLHQAGIMPSEGSQSFTYCMNDVYEKEENCKGGCQESGLEGRSHCKGSAQGGSSGVLEL